jgi:hypothetical protein
MRMVPKWVYEALKHAADANGGVGSGMMFDLKDDGRPDYSCPRCGYGLAYAAGVLGFLPEMLDETLKTVKADDPVSDMLYQASEEAVLPFSYVSSDLAVKQARNTLGIRRGRVPFEAWAEALRLVPEQEESDD